MLGIVGFCLVLLISVAGTGIWQMSRIAQELEGISERGLPLTGILMRVATHQLEQSISLERALRASNAGADDKKAAQQFEEAFASFKSLADKVDAEIVQSKRLAHTAYENAASDEARAFYMSIEEELTRVGKQHKLFDEHVYKAFKISKTDPEAALALLPVIEREEKELNHALEQSLFRVGDYSKKAAETAAAHEKFALQLLIAISVFAVFASTIVSFFFVRRTITNPLQQITSGLTAVSNDDFSIELDVRNRDEIGEVAHAYSEFKEALKKAKELQTELNEREKRADEERKAMMRDLADQFERSVGGIVNTVASAATELNAAAQTMTDVSNKGHIQASDVAAASEQASSNVSSIAAATEEMSVTIGEISQQVEAASEMSVSAVNQSFGTKTEITELADKARQISRVVSLISEIAEQTNLLALNATIEAARAGEAGKGFSVVASEVKELANQTAKATEDITKQIEEMQVATENSVGSIDGIGQVITKLNESSTAIAAAIEEQGVTTKDIARNIQEASTGTSEVTYAIAGVTASSQDAGETAKEVLSTSGELSMMAETLKSEVDKFLMEVRAA